MTEEGSKLDMKREREGQHHYHQNHTMIFLPELDDFYTEAFENNLDLSIREVIIIYNQSNWSLPETQELESIQLRNLLSIK